jgi:hypothetical protein
VTNDGVLEREKGPEMSEAQFSFTLGNEVEIMTTTISVKHFHDAPPIDRVRTAELARPTGITRLVVRISTIMLIWAANRSNRAARTSQEQARLVYEVREQLRREHQALKLHARVF